MPTILLDVPAERNALSDLTMDLHSRRIQVWVEDGRLRWSAPHGAMTVPLLTRVKALEWDLAALLAAELLAAEPPPAISTQDGASTGVAE